MPLFIPPVFSRLFRPPPKSDVVEPVGYPTDDERHNGRLVTLEGVFMSLAYGGAASFFVLFAIELGASNLLVGWLTSGPALLNLLWLIPCARLIQRASSYREPMVIGSVIHRALMVSLLAVPLLPPAWQAWGLILLVSLMAFPTSLWAVAIQASWGEMFSPQHISIFLSRRWALSGIVIVLSVLALGKFLDLVAFPTNFQLMFMVIGAVSLGSTLVMWRFRLPEKSSRHESDAGAAKETLRLSCLIHRHKPFLLFEVCVLIAFLSFFAAVPVLRIYWVRDLEANALWVGLLSGVLSAGNTVGILWFGRRQKLILDRRVGLYILAGVLVLYPLLSASFTSLPPQIAIGLIAGFFQGGKDLLFFNRLMRVSTRESRPTFFAIHHMMSNVAALLGPLLGTALVDTLGSRMVLTLAGALGLFSSLLMFLIGWRESVSSGQSDDLT